MPDENITKQHQNYFNEASKMMMFRAQLGLLVVLLIALLMAGSDRANAGSTLTAKQIRAEIVGKWLTVKGRGGNAQAMWAQNHKLRGRTTGGYVVSGTWKFRGNGVCTKANFRRHKEVCGSVRRSGKGYIWSGSGAQIWVN